MCYNKSVTCQRGRTMDNPIMDLYKLPNISQYENVDLLTLSEQCAALEEKVFAIAAELPKQDYAIITEYILMRNDLELETFKTALRWGKKHYK